MVSTPAKAAAVDAYVQGLPGPAQAQLQALRRTIHAAVPGLSERISYGIPTFDLGGKYVVYMGGFKDHVSLYPVTAAVRDAFKGEIDPYLSGKGTARFSLDAPLPSDLIARVVTFIAKARTKAA